MDSFIKKQDIEELKKHGVKCPEDINIFIDELVKYFNETWREEFIIKETITSLEQLNKKYLNHYPSFGGFQILDDSFTGPNCPIDILCDKSKSLLGYFYDIHFR